MISPIFNPATTGRIFPKVSLGFTNASLDPRITFTRADATATRTNSSGLIETVAADTPRLDYDPISLVSKGLLVEESRTNLVVYSGAVGDTTKTWGLNSCTASLNAVIAPDGTLSGTEITSTSATTEVRPRQDNRAITAGTNVAFSCFCKLPPVSGMTDPSVRFFIRTVVSGVSRFTQNAVTYS